MGNPMTETQDRKAWPFATLLPWSVMYNYPPPQFMKPTAPPAPAAWPPPMDEKLRDWRDRQHGLSEPIDQIYVHVPFCPFICDYCPFYKIKNETHELHEKFTDLLVREIELYGDNPGVRDREFSVVYFGGGTATELSPAQLGRIVATLRAKFRIRKDAEFTLEGVARQMLQPGYLEECFA